MKSKCAQLVASSATSRSLGASNGLSVVGGEIVAVPVDILHELLGKLALPGCLHHNGLDVLGAFVSMSSTGVDGS